MGRGRTESREGAAETPTEEKEKEDKRATRVSGRAMACMLSWWDVKGEHQVQMTRKSEKRRAGAGAGWIDASDDFIVVRHPSTSPATYHDLLSCHHRSYPKLTQAVTQTAQKSRCSPIIRDLMF